MSTTPQKYFTLLTPFGSAAFANAPVSGTMVNLSHMAVGDGGGAEIEPTELMTQLVREVHRVPISSVIIDEANPNWIVIEAVLPANIGGWTIRETGVVGDAKFLSIGNFPATYKPFLAEGAAKDLTIRMIVQVSNASVVNLTVDPSVTVVTQKSLANVLQRYLTKSEADARYLQSMPIASTTTQGLVELATVTETRTGTDTARAVTPAGLKAVTTDHAEHADPHPQYLTELEGDDKYLVSASTSQRGIVELATIPETQAGTDETRAVTPAGVAALMQKQGVWQRKTLVTSGATFTVPAGVYMLRVYAIGKGADGEPGRQTGGDGGSGGGCAWGEIAVVPGQVIPVSITSALSRFGDLLEATAGVGRDAPGVGKILSPLVKSTGTAKGGLGGKGQKSSSGTTGTPGAGGAASGSPLGDGGNGATMLGPIAGGGGGAWGGWTGHYMGPGAGVGGDAASSNPSSSAAPGTAGTANGVSAGTGSAGYLIGRDQFTAFTDPLLAPCVGAIYLQTTYRTAISEPGCGGFYGMPGGYGAGSGGNTYKVYTGPGGFGGGGGGGMGVNDPALCISGSPGGYGGGGGGGGGTNTSATAAATNGGLGGPGCIAIFY